VVADQTGVTEAATTTYTADPAATAIASSDVSSSARVKKKSIKPKLTAKEKKERGVSFFKEKI
jgi:hypothetical protein